MTSHAHPFAVIMKAAEPLALYSHLIPEQFRRVSRLIQLIAFKWNLPFPSSGDQVIQSSKASSRRSALVVPSNRQNHSRSHPYPKPDAKENAQSASTSVISAGAGGVVDGLDSKSSIQCLDKGQCRDFDARHETVTLFFL
jgi:hypothetical protein